MLRVMSGFGLMNSSSGYEKVTNTPPANGTPVRLRHAVYAQYQRRIKMTTINFRWISDDCCVCDQRGVQIYKLQPGMWVVRGLDITPSRYYTTAAAAINAAKSAMK
jgi:hypothetical protein